MTPEEAQLEDARLMSIMAPFEGEDIYNSDEVDCMFSQIFEQNFSPVSMFHMSLKVVL